MAEDKELDLDTGEEPKSKAKLIIILIALIVVLLGGGAAAFFLLSGNEEPEEMEGVAEEVKTQAVYIPLKPDFVVTYSVGSRQRFAQISVSLMTRNQDVVNAVQAHMPLIRNNLVSVFSSQEFDELQTHEGKEALRQMALEEVQLIIEEQIGLPGIEQVLFTNFVMQ